jgi:hypothetical protein
MGVFTFVLVIIILSAIIAPIAKGLGDRLATGAPDGRDLARLKAELERADQRLAETERRLQLAEDEWTFRSNCCLRGARPAAFHPQVGGRRRRTNDAPGGGFTPAAQPNPARR